LRVLLAVAPYVLPFQESESTERLGLLYLAASLRRSGIQVAIYDPTVSAPLRVPEGYLYGRPADEVRRVLERWRPDVLGISVHQAVNLDGARLLSRLAKEISAGEIVTVAGGVYPSVSREAVLIQCPEIDYAIQGEAEESFVELVRALDAGHVHEATVDGLIWRSSAGLTANPKESYIEDLDALPFPARDLVDIGRFMHMQQSIYGVGSRPSLSLLTSRSCPHQCSFCNMWMIHGKKWRPRSPENVLAEIDEMVGRWGAQDLFIMDDNFTLRSDRVVEICEGMIRRGHKLRWSTPNGISAKGATPEMAHAMKAAGCRSVCVAIETGSEEFRRSAMNKRVSNEEIRSAVHAFRGAGIPVGGLLMLGMPGETDVRFAETVRLVKELPLTWIVVSFTFPHVGTRLFDQLVECGYIDGPIKVASDTYGVPAFETPDFTRDALVRRKSQLYREFYGSKAPRIIWDVGTKWPYLGGFFASHLRPGLRSMAGSATRLARGAR
jgi:anaerobic magnesium-protoporphyrin IX monomethyl ester cyclase